MEKQTVHQLVEKLGIHLELPKIPDHDLKAASYILIRHAYSEYNHKAYEIEQAHGEHSEQMLALKGDKTMFDPGLHEIGILQAESNQSNVNEINFKVVFVSPMQRTLQTCIHMFKNHPNKKNIRFIVLPVVREVLETSNDIAHDIDYIVDKYSHGKEICNGIHFDFSLNLLHGQPKLWQIFSLANLKKQKDLILSLQVNEKGEINHQDVILERLVAHHPRYENHKDLFARAKVIRQYLREYLNANHLDESKQEKYGVISHSRIIATLTSKGVTEDDELIDFIWFKNCQMLPFHDF